MAEKEDWLEHRVTWRHIAASWILAVLFMGCFVSLGVFMTDPLNKYVSMSKALHAPETTNTAK